MNMDHYIPHTNITFTELNAIFFRSCQDGLHGDLITLKDSKIYLYIAGAAKTSFRAQTA